MSDPIEDIISNIIAIEGSEYTDDPDDPGGPTKYGVTQAALSEYLGRPAAIIEVQNLSEADARGLYYERYVARPGFGKVAQLSVSIARELVDTGVNLGQAIAAMFLQRVLNAFNRGGADYSDIAVDGECGGKTLAAFKAYLESRGLEGERVMLAALNALQGERYVRIAETRESSEKYAYGWMRARVAT